MEKMLPDSDVAAIERTLEKAMNALAADEIEEWLTFWTEDAVIMPPGMPRVVGHAAFRDCVQHIPERITGVSDVQIEGRDDFAVLTASLTIPRVEGGEDAGKQIATLLKQPDGRWLIAAVAFNFDTPTPLKTESEQSRQGGP